MGKPRKHKTSPKRMAEKARHLEAAKLRIAGYNFTEIASKLGYTGSSGAYKAVVSVMSEAERETGTELLEVELQRLDEMLRAVWPKARKGGLANVDRVLRIAEQRAKLLGIGGPKKIELSGPDGGPIKTEQGGLIILPPEMPEPGEPVAGADEQPAPEPE